MNYRHIYHAGNFADVVKHITLIELLRHLAKKPEPFCYLDTHAGIGRYPLTAIQAQKTLEYRGGVGRLIDAAALPAPLADYVALVRSFDPTAQSSEQLQVYPGSPALARALLRPQDRAVLAELHSEDGPALKRLFAGDPQVAVHLMDGYHALKAFLPPKERRGLVLVDPPFEVEDEFERLVEGLKQAHRRWATGIYALWYPVKDRREVHRFQQALKKTGIRKQLLIELCLYPDDDPRRLNGCGLVVVNPPWQFDEKMREALTALAPLLTDPAQTRIVVDWLVPE